MRPLIVLVSYPGFGSIAVPPCLLLLFFFSAFFFCLEYFVLVSVYLITGLRITAVYFLCSKPVSRFCLEHKYC